MKKFKLIAVIFILLVTLTGCGAPNGADFEEGLREYISMNDNSGCEIKEIKVRNDSIEKGDNFAKAVCDIVTENDLCQFKRAYSVKFTNYEKNNYLHPDGGWYCSGCSSVDSNSWSCIPLRGVNENEISNALYKSNLKISKDVRSLVSWNTQNIAYISKDNLRNVIINVQNTDLENLTDEVSYSCDLVSAISTVSVQGKMRFSFSNGAWNKTDNEFSTYEVKFNPGYEFTADEETIKNILCANPIGKNIKNSYNLSKQELSIQPEQISNLSFIDPIYLWSDKMVYSQCNFTLSKSLGTLDVSAVMYFEREKDKWTLNSIDYNVTPVELNLSGEWHGLYGNRFDIDLEIEEPDDQGIYTARCVLHDTTGAEDDSVAVLSGSIDPDCSLYFKASSWEQNDYFITFAISGYIDFDNEAIIDSSMTPLKRVIDE